MPSVNVSSGVLLTRLLTRSRLRQLQLVHQVATLGSLQRAAEAVGLSQPAATYALLEVESLLGLALFERHAKGTRLTPAGAAILPRVRQALQAIAECADIVSSMHAGASGVVRIGATGAGISGLLSQVLPEFTARFPAVTVDVRQQPPEQLVRGLLEETLDVVVFRKPGPLPPETEFHEILTDRYAIVCSPRHSLAAESAVTLAGLASHLWLMPPTGTIAERDFHRLWGQGPWPTRLCRVTSQSPLLLWSLLEQRQALAFIPYNTVRQWILAATLTELPGQWGPELTAVGALVRKDENRGGPVHDLVSALQRYGTSEASSPAL